MKTMRKIEAAQTNLNDIELNALKIQLASPDCIQKWAETVLPDG